MTEIVTRRRAMLGSGALLLGLALLTGGCAGNSSKGANPDDLYDASDNNNDNNLDQDEWNQAYRYMDTNGDGVVSRDEFNAALGGGGRGGR